MKRLAAFAALLTFLCSAAAAVAAEPGADNKSTRADRRFDAKGDKKSRPTFEECDKDKDGALNTEEFVACFPRGGQKRFAAIDANKDNKISLEELNAFKQARGEEKRRDMFNACDTNKDGALSLEEFTRCKPGKGRSVSRI